MVIFSDTWSFQFVHSYSSMCLKIFCLFCFVKFDLKSLPDLHIQTGIRSAVNQSDWLSDNHVVNSFPFDLPPANKDKCQQLALRYNDVDWVASAVECGSTTSYYYACQIKCKFVPCFVPSI